MTKLREIRQKKGISMVDLAKLTGIPYRTIQDLDSGSMDINRTSAAKLYLIAKALGTKMEHLIELDNLQGKM